VLPSLPEQGFPNSIAHVREALPLYVFVMISYPYQFVSVTQKTLLDKWAARLFKFIIY